MSDERPPAQDVADGGGPPPDAQPADDRPGDPPYTRDFVSNRETEVPDGRGVRLPVVLVGAGAWSWRILAILALLYVVARGLGHLMVLVIPFATSILVTALLMPIAGWLRRKGLGRGTSTLITIVFALAVLGGVIFFVVDRAIAGYPTLADQASTAIDRLQGYLTNGPFHFQRSSIDNIGSTITKNLQSHQGAVTSGVISAGKTAIDVATGSVLFLFLTIFFVYDGDRVWDWVVRLLPERGEELARGAGYRAWRTLTGYIGGQFVVALFHAVAISVTLLVLGAPLIAPLALIVFIFSFVPIVGAIIAGAFAVVVVLVAQGPFQAVVLVIVLVIENQIEGHVLQPLVVGRYVRLHPIAIISTITAGSLIAGLPGAIFGVPLVAAVNAAAKFLSGREDIDGNVVHRPRDERRAVYVAERTAAAAEDAALRTARRAERRAQLRAAAGWRRYVHRIRDDGRDDLRDDARGDGGDGRDDLRDDVRDDEERTDT